MQIINDNFSETLLIYINPLNVSIFFVETMQSQEFLFCFNILSNKFPAG
jgi:hypothetical protein